MSSANKPRLLFSRHAVIKMFARRITVQDVSSVIESGETISRYSDKTPFSKRLLLGYVGNRPLHVVVADDVEAATSIVVTTYHPDPSQWEPDSRTRRNS